ncbi:MarR family winged helix-turn-helix transcriptional regulator [Paenibacillus sp. FSL K6-1230]|uniref:MarR family winged helix-turn-helix transcriptional regulator n=1 Tax=Paenibacillus sp. FSL K6-1230 TaxID=2921603 RepID=UPI004046A464
MMDDQSNLDLRLFRVWMKSTRAAAKNIEKDIQSNNISIENFITLELLYSKGPQTVQQISERLSIPSGSITYVINKLEKKGLVERKQHPEDKRVFHVILTEQGKELFDEIFPKHVEMISRSFSFISDEEKKQLIDLLKRIGFGIQNMQEE